MAVMRYMAFDSNEEVEEVISNGGYCGVELTKSQPVLH